MINKIKMLILPVVALFALAPAALIPATVSAAEIQRGVCSGATNLQITSNPSDNSCAIDDANGTGKVNTLLTQIINIFSVVVGVVAVIMIIVAGFRYITSGGASDKVTGAKNTILYALIGLIIVALAQVIVKFVLQKTV